MSPVENSLDNRDIEVWFSIFKTELIYRLDIKRMLFVQYNKKHEICVFFQVSCPSLTYHFIKTKFSDAKNKFTPCF